MQIISMQVIVDCSLTNQIGSKVTQWKTQRKRRSKQENIYQ